MSLRSQAEHNYTERELPSHRFPSSEQKGFSWHHTHSLSLRWTEPGRSHVKCQASETSRYEAEMLSIPLYTEVKRNIPHLELLLENSSDGLGAGLLKKIKPHRAQPLTYMGITALWEPETGDLLSPGKATLRKMVRAHPEKKGQIIVYLINYTHCL